VSKRLRYSGSFSAVRIGNQRGQVGRAASVHPGPVQRPCICRGTCINGGQRTGDRIFGVIMGVDAQSIAGDALAMTSARDAPVPSGWHGAPWGRNSTIQCAPASHKPPDSWSGRESALAG